MALSSRNAVMRTQAYILIFLLWLSLSHLRGQSQDLSFEVSSIRPNHSMSQAIGGTYGIRPGGQVSVRNVTLLDLMYLAYSVRQYQVTGGPSWLSTRRFDVHAKPSGAVSVGDGRKMLQTLLSDRFGLKFHRSSKRVQGYTMHLPKGAGKLRISPAQEKESGFGIMSMQEMRGESVTMPALAHALTEILGSPVEDRTNASSRYSVALKWAAHELTVDGQPGLSLFSALWEELGIRLKADRVVVEVIVVDKVNENPTEN